MVRHHRGHEIEQEFKNFLDVQGIGLQPKDAAYINQLQELKNNYIAIDEDDFLCNDAWDKFSPDILERKYDPIIAKE